VKLKICGEDGGDGIGKFEIYINKSIEKAYLNPIINYFFLEEKSGS